MPTGKTTSCRVALASPAANGGAFQGRSADVDSGSSRKDELNHLWVQEALHWLSVDMCYQVSRTQACFKRWAVVLHSHDEMLHSVYVRITIVDSYGTDSETKSPGSTLDDDGGF